MHDVDRARARSRAAPRQPTEVTTKRRLLRWLGWFALVNVVLLALVGLRYLWYYATLGPSMAWIYALLAFVGQMSAFAFVPMLCLVPVILLLPRPRLVHALGVIVGSAVLSLLVLDSLLFAENRYHIGVLTFTLLAPATWGFLALYFLVAVVIEAMLAQWVWKRTERVPRRRIGRYVALAIVVCFVSSHLIHLWAEAHFYVPVTSFTRYLPWFAPLRDSLRLVPPRGRPALPAGSSQMRAATAFAQRHADRGRRHACRRARADSRAEAQRARPQRRPLR